jgi:hypothetical protein
MKFCVKSPKLSPTTASTPGKLSLGPFSFRTALPVVGSLTPRTRALLRRQVRAAPRGPSPSESLVYGAPNHRWPCRGADTAWAGLAAVMAPRTTCSRTRGYTEAEQRRPLGHVPVGPARGERVPHFSTANPTFELESSVSAPLRSARRRQQLRNPRPKPTTLSSASRGNGRQAHGGTGLCSWRLLLIAKLIRKLLHRPVSPITRSERALTCSFSGHLAWPCAKTAVGPSSKLWSLPREGGHPCRHQIFFVAAPVSRLQLR